MAPDHWMAYVEHWADTMRALGAAHAANDAWRIVAIEHAAQDAMVRWSTPLLDVENRDAADRLVDAVTEHGNTAWTEGRALRPAPAVPDVIRGQAVALLLSQEA